MASQQEINVLEERAQELVKNLELLHQQVGSYQTAKVELEKAGARLTALVASTESLSKESHEIIEAINHIGSSKIFQKLDKLAKASKTHTVLLVVAFLLIAALQVGLFVLHH